MWQDLVFMLGSGLSIVFLAPTLRDSSARVPLGTSLPSMTVGGAYAVTFTTLDMTFSAAGALSAGSMWALIALFRSPGTGAGTLTRREDLRLLARDVRRVVERRRDPASVADQYVTAEAAAPPTSPRDREAVDAPGVAGD